MHRYTLDFDIYFDMKSHYLQAVEINSRRAFSESNIGGWDYLRNMVQLPFYLQNSALQRVRTAQQIAAKRYQMFGAEDFSTSLQRSVRYAVFHLAFHLHHYFIRAYYLNIILIFM